MNRLLRTLANHTFEQLAFRPAQRFARRARVPLVRARRTAPTPLRVRATGVPVPPLHAVDTDTLALLDAGTLRLAGQRAQWSWHSSAEPTSVDPLYLYSYHDLSWLAASIAHPSISPELRQRLQGWLENYLDHPPASSSPYWDPYPLSTRILNLVALQSNPPTAAVDDERARLALARWVAALTVQTERHLQGNHLLRYRAARLLGLAVSGAERDAQRTAAAWRAFADEVELQFEPDGVHEERSPGYHVQSTLDLLYVLALADRTHAPSDAATRIERIAARAVTALDVLCHDDGLVAAFGDSAPALNPNRESIRNVAARIVDLPAPEAANGDAVWRHSPLPYSGYSKIHLGRTSVYLNWGRFGAYHQPGHAHSDLFAFELDLDGERIIVDPGPHSYHDIYWRQRARRAVEHNTPALADHEQAELWSRFRCGWRPRVLAAEWRNKDTRLVFCGVAEAFGPSATTRLERTIEFGLRAIDVCDTVVDAQRFSVALTLNPKLQLDRHDEQSVLVRGARRTLKITAVDGDLAVDAGWVSSGIGRPQQATRVSLRATDARLRWRLDIAP